MAVTSKDRIRKPRLERTQPVRSWSTLFDAPNPSARHAERPPREHASDPGERLSDVVARSVDLGYRVVDEYMREGQKAARRLREGSGGERSVTGDLQDLGVRLVQYASDFSALWVEFMQLALTGVGGPEVRNRSQGASTAAAMHHTEARRDDEVGRGEHAGAGNTQVTIEIVSAQPTKITLDLHPDAASRPLIVHALRAVDAEAPRLTEVSFQPGTDDAPACLRLRVPAGHPAGVYNGLLIDVQTNRPAGTLSVCVGALPDAA
jgi:hypothetical protein